MKYKEIVEMPQSDLTEFFREQKDKLFKLKFTHSISPIENTASIRHTRKQIARAMTILNSVKKGVTTK